jgi:hypothetical protein
MTNLETRKSKLHVKTGDTVYERGQRREVIIEMNPYSAIVRLKGMKHGFALSYAGMYNLAVKIAVQAERDEKAKAKKAGKK